MSNVLLMRKDLASYMECGATPAYSLMGEGFTSLSETKNPKEYSRQYVHESTERTDVVGYAPAVAYNMDAYSEDPVALEIMEITDSELTGTAAQRNVVSVHLYEPGGTTNTFVAFKRAYAVIPDAVGDGTEALVYTGNLKAVGDIVPGTFNTTTNTFTADE